MMGVTRKGVWNVMRTHDSGRGSEENTQVPTGQPEK